MNIRNWVFILVIGLGFSCNSSQEENQEGAGNQVVSDADQELKNIDSLISLQSNNPNLYYRRALIQAQLNNPEEALADIQQAKEINDTLEYLYLAEADIYLNTDNPLLGFPDSKKAIQTLEDFCASFPNNITVRAELARLHSIVMQFKESNLILSEIMEKEPSEAKWRFFLGNNLREMGDTALALQAYQRAIELNPEFVDAYSEAAYLMEKQQNPLAIQMYRNSLRIAPTDPLIRFNLATCLQTFNENVEAIQEFKRLIEMEPQNPAAFYNLGLAYYDMDSLNRARGSFENAIRMAPELVNGYYMLALTNELLGDYDKAIQLYKTTLNLDPEYMRAQNALNDLVQTVQANS